MLWQICKCGIIVDADEKKCPVSGIRDADHELSTIWLSSEELSKFYGVKLIWTKHVAALESMLH